MLSGNEILKGEGGGDESQLTDVSSGAFVQVVLLKGYVAKLTKGISSENVVLGLKMLGPETLQNKGKTVCGIPTSSLERKFKILH